MELKEYIQIVKKNIRIFLGVWALVIGAVLIWYFNLPVKYDVSLPIEISRKGEQKTNDYQYDEYYRLEADNKFADTITKWFSDPSVVREIYRSADNSPEAKTVRDLSKKFRAEKLAPGYIQVQYQTAYENEGKALAKAIREIVAKKADKLNEASQSPDWFSPIFGEVFTIKHRLNILPVLFSALVGGFILAVVSVLIKHYWKE